MRKRKLLFFMLCFNLFISAILFLKLIKQKNVTNKDSSSASKIKYTENNRYLINNNVAQYSTYIIVDRDDASNIEYRIEAYITLNKKYIKDFGEKENFKCLVKLEAIEEVIEIEAIDSIKNSKMLYKRTFFLNLENFKKYSLKKEVLLNSILVAVIYRHDFEVNLDANMNKLDELNLNTSVKLPYSLIKFQKPSVLKNIQPRLHSVGLCIHYTYQIPKQILDWFDIQLDVGINEIWIYDALENNTLTQILNRKYGNEKRLVIKPYNINFHDLCDETELFEQYEGKNYSKSLLNKICKEFYEHEFHDKYKLRFNHEQITSNDCYTVMSQKHELIGYFDLDEFIFPRDLDASADYLYKTNYCSKQSSSSICEQNVFNKNNSKFENKFYNYLHSHIKIHAEGRKMNEFMALYFEHGSYLIPNEIEKKLIHDISLLVNKVNDLPEMSPEYPLKLYLNDFNKNNSQHTFLIYSDDASYVKNLYNTYNDINPCVYNQYIKSIDKLNENFLRYFYFITEPHERFGKVFFYYKNIKSISHHYAEYNHSHWWITADSVKGHHLAHFRNEFKIATRNFTGTIRKLHIDFEMIYYLLQKFSSFCQK